MHFEIRIWNDNNIQESSQTYASQNYEWTLMELGVLGGFLGSKMSLDWLKIGLNSVEKIIYYLWEYHWKANSEIQSSPYKLPQRSG